MSLLKSDELDVIMALPKNANKEKLSKRALDLLEMLECQLEVCSKLPPKINVRAILCLLAGSRALDPALHAQFAAAGYIASIQQIKGLKKPMCKACNGTGEVYSPNEGMIECQECSYKMWLSEREIPLK